MYKILLSAGGKFLEKFLAAGTIKWAFSASMLFGFSLLLNILVGFLPVWFNADGLPGLFGFMSSGMWYFFDYCKGGLALSMLFSAAVTRFIIRRIPFFG